MLLPGSLLDTLLFLRALGLLIAPLLLGVLLLVVLVLPLLLLGPLLLIVLVLALLLLGVLLLIVLVLALLLLGVLLLVVLVLTLLLLSVLLLLRVLWLLLRMLWLLLRVLWLLLLTLWLSMLLLGMVLLRALLILLCVRGSSDSEKQRQNGCAGDSNYFHGYYLQTAGYIMRVLGQAFCCRVADSFAGHEKINSLIFLPVGGVAVSPPISMGSALFIGVPLVS
jgi:hypothetical protein